MTTQTGTLVTLKEEKRDDQDEIDQLAAKMVEANKAKLASTSNNASSVQLSALLASSSSGNISRPDQNTLLNGLGRNTTLNGAEKTNMTDKNKQKEVIDEESLKGRFGWTEDTVTLPYIIRRDGEYCSVRIFEHRVAKTYSRMMRPEIFSCVFIKSCYATEAEARLLNEINIKHCDFQFGREIFTVRDLVIKLSDALEFLNFLQICQDKILKKSCDPHDRCGFFRIAGESVVPFTVVNGTKYVPLFYFEGETGNLDKKAIQITGWDLAFLKFCCKVQGIREELFANDSYPAASIEDIRQQFPANTEVQLYWPSRSPLDLQGNTTATCGGAWVKKPPGNPPPLPSAPPALATPVIQKIPSLAAPALPARQPAPVPAPQAPQAAPLSAAPGRVPSSVASSSAYYNSWQSIPPYGMPRTLPVTCSSRNASTSNPTLSMPSSSSTSSSSSRHPSQPTTSLPVAAPNLNAVAAGYMGLGMQLAHAQAAAILGLQNRQAVSGSSHAAAAAAAAAALEPLLRNNGLQTYYRSAQNSHHPSAASAYSSSQSPRSGVVPGISPHSRSGAGASPRPGLPVPPSSGLPPGGGQPKPPPALIPVNGSYSMYPLDSAIRQQLQKSVAHSQQPQLHHHQQQQQQHEAPFKVQSLPIENQMIPCVNSRQYVFNNFMVALSDVAAYLFPRFGHHACKQVLQDGLRVTLYEANAQQLQAFRTEGKTSTVNNVHGEKIYLVNVRDIIQYMPQIRYMMSRLDLGSLSHNPSSKRQRIS